MGQVKNLETDSISPDTENIIKECTNIADEANKRYKCTFPECSLSFLRPSRLERHIRVHTGERHFKCSYPECNKAYTNNCHLKRHMKFHSIQLHRCPECELYLRNQHNLKRHFNRMHKDLDRLTCKECKKVFPKKYQLQRHMTEHSTSYTCKMCNKTFTNIRKFNRHKKSHEPGDKQYPCPVLGCTEVLGKWLFLQAHIKTQHVNDHRCKDCDKVFLSRNHLRNHSIIHVKDRPRLSCPYDKCPRVYMTQSTLTTHIRIYHLDKKFECDICKVRIGTKSNLRFHIEKLHMSERKIKEIKRTQRKRRKDIGIPTRSAVSKLVGVNLPPKIEKLILERKEPIEYLNQFEIVTEEPKTDS
ncbi:zinc finger protein 888-like [Ceratina calcarata]|uniref:Zinc finger protein 888-like n=1 Tax=Ceratina calcarata TaxID=156304 RepID=A0AAJ7WCW6_9HYME|nr:zinc finger protein 888-like [Ceratina calcarata]